MNSSGINNAQIQSFGNLKSLTVKSAQISQRWKFEAFKSKTSWILKALGMGRVQKFNTFKVKEENKIIKVQSWEAWEFKALKFRGVKNLKRSVFKTLKFGIIVNSKRSEVKSAQIWNVLEIWSFQKLITLIFFSVKNLKKRLKI